MLSVTIPPDMNKLRHSSFVVLVTCVALLTSQCESSNDCTSSRNSSGKLRLLYKSMRADSVCLPNQYIPLPELPVVQNLTDSQLFIAAYEITQQVHDFLHLYHQQLRYEEETTREMMGLLYDRCQVLWRCVHGDVYKDRPVILKIANHFSQLGTLVKKGEHICFIQDKIEKSLMMLNYLNSRMRAIRTQLQQRHY